MDILPTICLRFHRRPPQERMTAILGRLGPVRLTDRALLLGVTTYYRGPIMADAIKVRVPKALRPPFLALLNMPEEDRTTLLVGLGSARPARTSHELARALAPTIQSDVDELAPILGLLAGLWINGRYQERYTAAQVASDACRSVRDEVGSTMTAGDAEWASLERFLGEALALDATIGVTAKAMFIGSRVANLFTQGRVITDIRPVFRSAAADAPEAALVVHTLEVNYWDGNRDQNIYVTVDRGDIAKLKSALDRALEKEATLSDVMARANISVLSTASEQAL